MICAVLNFKRVFCTLMVFFCSFSAPPSQAYNTEFSTYSESLTRHLITAMRKMYADDTINIEACSTCYNNLQDRHFYQRTRDVDFQVDAFLRMIGINTGDLKPLEIRPYTKQDVTAALISLHDKFEKFALDTRMIDPSSKDLNRKTVAENRKHTFNPLTSLDRIELLLSELGSPSIQPNTVLHRARLMSELVKRLCDNGPCKSVPHQLSSPVSVKRPVHVFTEVNLLIIEMNAYVEKHQLTAVNGVANVKARGNVITPAEVYRLAGVAMADLVAINYAKFGTSDAYVGQIPPAANPTEVWREVNYAKRLLKAVLQ